MAILQLKIVLDDITPKIWRRFLVNDADSFQKLHETIQAVMGWSGCHLYRFYVGTEEIGVPNPDFSDFQKTTDAGKTLLKERLNREKQKIGYIYDFGDFWDHTITVEKILGEGSVTKTPVCLAGARACPPEDCGGIWGYLDLMKLQKNKRDPQYKELITGWLGEDYDFEHLDIGEANEALEIELVARKKLEKNKDVIE